MDIINHLTKEFSLKPWQTENVVKLIDEGNTIPFIARYRKEATGSLDDQLLRDLYDRLEYLRNLNDQKEKIYAHIETGGQMTDEIAAAIDNASTLTELEDIYRPFRPKRKTRASAAKAKGLQGLADLIYSQNCSEKEILEKANDYINDDVADAQTAVDGALDIIAEIISDDAKGRSMIRYSCRQNGYLFSCAVKDDLHVYEMYADYREPVRKAALHRVLAVNRGEKEGYLKAGIDFDSSIGITILKNLHIMPECACQSLIERAIEDSYLRLIFPSIEREIRNELTEAAEEQAIKLFAENTRQLLMQPPVKNKVTMGLDPGYRTGCKVTVVDKTGKVLDTAVIYPAPPHNKTEEAKKIISDLIKKYNVSVIAIGNGTASKETEIFAADVIKENNGVGYMIVSEAGASVYSASKLAAAEFPDYDVSLRSAISIARRLQDPLAELVKIDPKAIGVGQYQHDMPPKKLEKALNAVVEDCVNCVGVDLNTASAQLLNRVSGISSAVGSNIVKYREENGAFISREELKNVPKLGNKTFEQCAGFLRISDSNNVLDNTAVHPESYKAAYKLLDLCGISDTDVRNGNISAMREYIAKYGIDTTADKLGVGAPTLSDIINEIEKPGRDPRDELPAPLLRTDVMGIDDLKVGMRFKGTVRNVIDFGAFVDIGVHQDGLVHISQISNKFIKHPSDVLKVGDIVDVVVISIDKDKKRIGLSIKEAAENAD